MEQLLQEDIVCSWMYPKGITDMCELPAAGVHPVWEMGWIFTPIHGLWILL